MNDMFGIETTYFGRPFRAGLGVGAPRAKALRCSVLPLWGRTGGLFSQRPRAAAGGEFEQVFRIPGSLHPDGPQKLGICLWVTLPHDRAAGGRVLGYRYTGHAKRVTLPC